MQIMSNGIGGNGLFTLRAGQICPVSSCPASSCSLFTADEAFDQKSRAIRFDGKGDAHGAMPIASRGFSLVVARLNLYCNRALPVREQCRVDCRGNR